ncbi:unnamed protein product [Scytosiphon promiscuus]
MNVFELNTTRCSVRIAEFLRAVLYLAQESTHGRFDRRTDGMRGTQSGRAVTIDSRRRPSCSRSLRRGNMKPISFVSQRQRCRSYTCPALQMSFSTKSYAGRATC